METQADTQPISSHIPADERVRTCRPAVVRRAGAPGGGAVTARPGNRSEALPDGPEWNIVRGED
ncbi:hypothetical protein ACIQUQ_20520 [Streptomyces sp. NPDC101118]|uniref:hypothetical protein n=1 Tax=Streptomyces sp. NPDC101118 TaxID=3366109 RepID=UPI00382AED6A